MTRDRILMMAALIAVLIVPCLVIGGASEETDAVTDLGEWPGNGNSSNENAGYSYFHWQTSTLDTTIIPNGSTVYIVPNGDVYIEINKNFATGTPEISINTPGLSYSEAGNILSKSYIVSGTVTGSGITTISWWYLDSMGTTRLTYTIYIDMAEDSAPTYNYSLSFNANGGSGAPSRLTYGPTEDTSHNFTIPYDEPSRSGYEFGGWATYAGGPGIYNSGDIITVRSSQQSVTLYAAWEEIQQYTTFYLVFNDNGGSGGPGQLSYGPTTATSHTFTIPNTIPTWANHTFVKWSSSRTGVGDSYYPGNTINLGDTGTGNTTYTLYAIWEEVGYNYTLQFEANGGSGAPGTMTYGPTTATSHVFTIPDTIPTRNNYVFSGWGMSATAEELLKQPGDTVSVSSSNPSETLYAIWAWAPTTTYIVYFDANGGSGAPATINSGAINVSSYEVHIPSTVPTWSGHQFLGWSTSSSATSATYQPGDTFNMLPSATGETPRTITLYAVWATTFTFKVDFIVNNGSGAPSSLTYGPTTDTSHTFTLPSTTPTPDDPTMFEFAGWAYYPNGEGALVQPGGSVTVTASDDTDATLTLYASWHQIAYTFTLEFVAPEADSGVPDTLTSPTVATDYYTFTIPDTTPQREGYTFTGWVVGASSTGIVYQPGQQITVTSHFTWLTAQWEGIEYEYHVYFDANGGWPASVPGALYGMSTQASYTFTLPQVYPTRDGYTFLGWALSATGSAQYEIGGQITLYSSEPSVTLYAAWAEKGEVYVNLVGPTTVEIGDTITITATVESDTSTGTGVTWEVTTGADLIGSVSSTGSTWEAVATTSGTVVITATADDDSGASSSITVTILAAGMVLPTSISMTGPGAVDPGTSGQIYANVIPTNAVNRGVIWSITEGENLITYTTSATYRGGVLEFTARYAGTVTITATSTADSSIVGTYSLTILSGDVDEDNQTISLGGLAGMLGGSLFDGNTDIAGIVIYAIILFAIFLLIREPMPVLIISIPLTLIFTALGIVGTDYMILLIIVAVLGLALLARNIWRD